MQIYKPYCYIISILAIPFIFLGVSHYFLDFPSFLASYNYLKKIILNLHNFPHFKFEIYFSFFCALLPLFLTAYLFFNGRNMDSHGKAVWAEMKDIIKYEYRIFNIFKGMLDPIIRNEANKWAKANDKEFASIKSVYSRFMQVFTSYQVKSTTDSMSFEYEDLRTDNILLYIKIAQMDIDTLAPLIRILLESIAKNLLLKESKKFEERVYLFLDEFVRFGKLPFLLEMPALSRSYGVVLIFITQSNALIEKYYGKEDARIVNSTVAYKVIFKMDDLEYAKQVSGEIGKMTRKTRSHSTEKGQLITGGTSSIGKEAWDLLSAQDIMNIDKDEVIILVSGHKAKPLKLKANYYFKNKELLSRINWEVKPNEEVFDESKKVV
ncbi:type IV secretory system conjugative DNA transfer family protein [Helicobacter pylori]|nr:type IV secretory system conjugative DNA transfer family protein [Helicobacter pylori]